MVSDSGKAMVTPSIRFPYKCAGVQHNQLIIYIYISPRARSQAYLLGNFVFWYNLRLSHHREHMPNNKKDLSCINPSLYGQGHRPR